MSVLVHVVVAGPTLKKLTPAPTTSAKAFAPAGVVPSRGGPFANTIGNTGAPLSTTVPFGSSLVTPAPAIPAHTSTSISATGQTSHFITNPNPHVRRAESTEPTPPAPELQQWPSGLLARRAGPTQAPLAGIDERRKRSGGAGKR